MPHIGLQEFLKALDNFNPALVSEARNIVSESFATYRAKAESSRFSKPELLKYLDKILGFPDKFVYQILTQGMISDLGKASRYVTEAIECELWEVKSRDTYRRDVVREYSKEGEITYELACGSIPDFPSIIHEVVQDKSKIFLVDPYYGSNQRELRKYVTKLNAYVESFRIENGSLVTDVANIRGKSLTRKVKVPFAKVAYAHTILPFIDSSESVWNSRIYKRGYSSLKDFVKGARNIVSEDGGKLVMIDFRTTIYDALPKFEERFRILESKNLYGKIYGDEAYMMDVAVMVPK